MPPQPHPEFVDPLVLNIFRPEFLDCPWPVYDALRERGGPVAWSDFPAPGCWVVTGHRAALQTLRDPRFGKAGYWDQVAADRGGSDSETMRVIRSWMSQLDPPHHARVRRAFGKGFLPRTIESWRPRVAAVVAELLDRLADEDEFDLIAEFAFPLPAIVICELLGVPPEDRGRFRDWSGDLARIFDVDVSAETLCRSHDAVLAFRDYFQHLVKVRRAEPGDDLLDRLIRVHDEEGGISEEELLANATLLVWAGHETTMNLIANAMLALLRHPHAYARLAAAHGLAGAVVEEALRHQGPIRTTSRVALEDVEIAGQHISKGQMVVVVPQAANSDPAVYTDGCAFDLDRAAGPAHVAFGSGIHYCLGAPLARIEAELALGSLAARMPDLRLAGSAPDWGVNLFLRNQKTLRVTRGRATAAVAAP
jgi:pimeloyl-[acyl-carrier protein] synthase